MCSTSSTSWRAFFHALRPEQWTKNGLVLAAFFFAMGDDRQTLDPALFAKALGALVSFCMLSSAVYLFNDVQDQAHDRHHPVKRLRPVASGALSVGVALSSASVLVALALTLGFVLAVDFFWVLLGYALLQVAYSLGLKRISLLDVILIAVGFVLRALAGAVVIAVDISPWLLLCTLLLALFLALCKRRQEKRLFSSAAGDAPQLSTRVNMEAYCEPLLDQLISIVGAATVVSYSIYTLWPETVEKFGTARLGFTIPFVIFGIFRYLDLVYRHGEGEHPEWILLRDKPFWINLLLYGGTVALIIF